MITDRKQVPYPIPENEEQRLEHLKGYDILDSPPEEAFDRLVTLTRNVLDAPVSLVSLVSRDREWHKAAAGTEPGENPRDESFCAHAIAQEDPLVVPDAREDPRFEDYPLVTGERMIERKETDERISLVAYAGAPLETDEDVRLGTLCLVDDEPRAFPEDQIETLEMLAEEVVKQLELRLKTRKLERARAEAERANRAKSEYLARMSHDIRTPLNSISGIADLLDQSDLSPEQREYVTIFKHASETLLNLINDVLDLSKIEAGELELSEQVFDLQEFLDKSVSFLSRKAHDKGLELVLDVDPYCPSRIVGDPRRLQQIVVNLVGNAIKFTEEGEVIVRIRRENTDTECAVLLWEVEDTGPGIPEEDREKIFQSYKQSRPDFTQSSEGTGLGLAISQHLVGKMGGNMSVKSTVGEGSSFRFRLPFPLPGAEDRPETLLDVYREGSRSIDLDNKRVLVVDDHRSSRHVFRKILEEWGATVETAGGGQKALDLLERESDPHCFDLIILDRRMPDLDGFDVHEQIRERGLFDRIVIMVTSDDLKGDLQRAEEHGIQAYLLKPLSRKRLITVLKQYFSELEPETDAADEPEVRLYEPDDVDPPSVLVAEDSGTNRRILNKYLEDQPIDLSFAGDGQEAVEMFASHEVDLVFMDLRMPRMDGLEATRNIRGTEEKPEANRTPIIALSGDAIEERRKECLDAGCTEFVEKPVREEHVLELVQKHALPETGGAPG